MAVEIGFMAIVIFLMVIVFGMSIMYTFTQTGQGFGWPGKTRYAMFGVFSFVMIGIIFMGYVGWLYVKTGLDWQFIVNIGQQEFDLANGFFTVLVGAFVGLSLGLFALLKKQEVYGK
jgi:hypothetical protein